MSPAAGEVKGMENVKYYMNNPCEVLRVISDEFVEIKVYPKFVDDEFNGSGWCTECTAGSGYSRHTCREYQDVIDYIVDYGQSMIVVAESRLVHDNPIEFKQWISLRNSIKKLSEDENVIKASLASHRKEVSWLSQYSVDLKEELADLRGKERDLCEHLKKLHSDVRNNEREIEAMSASINLGSVVASMGVDELRGLIKAKVILDSLMSGGVDNWEWYGESMPDDVDSEVSEYLSSIKVTMS